MDEILDTERYPLHESDSDRYQRLVETCQAELEADGMFNLHGFVKTPALEAAVERLLPVMNSESFTHQRRHNIYFKKEIPGLAADHPALVEVETINHTLCADQLSNNIVMQVYEWQPLVAFLARVMNKPALFTMEDPLVRVNVMAYREGETLNWHFDRSEFTTTLLLQSPKNGGEFEYRTDLRAPENPNYEGVAKLLRGEDPEKKSLNPAPGTLNVFRGVNTPHRVTRIEGEKERIIAVYSYYDRPNVIFTPEEQIGFYGRRA